MIKHLFDIENSRRMSAHCLFVRVGCGLFKLRDELDKVIVASWAVNIAYILLADQAAADLIALYKLPSSPHPLLRKNALLTCSINK